MLQLHHPTRFPRTFAHANPCERLGPPFKVKNMHSELRWLIGFNLVLSVWLGMLANTWKGRSTYGWMVIGVFTSVIGVLLLILMPKLAHRMPIAAAPKSLQRKA